MAAAAGVRDGSVTQVRPPPALLYATLPRLGESCKGGWDSETLPIYTAHGYSSAGLGQVSTSFFICIFQEDQGKKLLEPSRCAMHRAPPLYLPLAACTCDAHAFAPPRKSNRHATESIQGNSSLGNVRHRSTTLRAHGGQAVMGGAHHRPRRTDPLRRQPSSQAPSPIFAAVLVYGGSEMPSHDPLLGTQLAHSCI